MKTRVAVVVAGLALAFVAATGCTVKNEATDKICQPKQKSHCNDCPKPDPSDSRVYVGWNTCADDGKSYVGGCTECAPEHPMAAAPPTNGPPGDGPPASGADKASSGVGSVALTPAPDDNSAAQPGSPNVDQGAFDSPGATDTGVAITEPSTTAGCHSVPLGRDLPELACAWSSEANEWEQCLDGHWYIGVYSSDTGTFGPAGTCSEVDDSP